MQLKIEFDYEQKFLPTARHRKSRTRIQHDTAYMDIPELSNDSFPVAFIVHDWKSVYDGAKKYRDFEDSNGDYRLFPEEIRYFKGKCYSPVRVTHGAAISTEFENEESISHSIERSVPWYIRPSYEDKEYTDKSIVVGDNKKDILDILHKEASKYVCFDGKFWKRCGEPRYVINTFGLGFNHGSTEMFIEYSYNGNIPASSYFNALQRKEAIEYGQSVAINRGDTKSVDRIGANIDIEVLLPDAVAVNPIAEHGNGNEFLNNLENIVSNSKSSFEAGIGCIALTMVQAVK